MRTFGKIIKYTLFCLLGLFILFLSALLLFEQPVPDFLLRRITNSLSNTNYLMRADSASFRFSHGLKINNPRIFDRRKPASRPIVSASCVDLALNLRRIPWSQRTVLKAVTIFAGVISVLGAVAGLVISILAETPVGATIVAVDLVAFLVCSVVGRAKA